MICTRCGTANPDNAVYCAHCGSPMAQGNPASTRCPNCGNPIHPLTTACPNCGMVFQPVIVPGTVDPRKSKIAAGLLGIFLGGLGVHNFYLGYTGKAVAQLILTLVGSIFGCFVFPLIAAAAAGIWGLVEGIMILAGSIDVDGHNIPLKD